MIKHQDDVSDIKREHLHCKSNEMCATVMIIAIFTRHHAYILAYETFPISNTWISYRYFAYINEVVLSLVSCFFVWSINTQWTELISIVFIDKKQLLYCNLDVLECIYDIFAMIFISHNRWKYISLTLCNDMPHSIQTISISETSKYFTDGKTILLLPYTYQCIYDSTW